MSFINHNAREVNCKIVYYGPGLGGKTTNLERIHAETAADRKGNLITMPTKGDRTIFFDFLPIEFGTVSNYRVRFHLYTVPGQVVHVITRQIVLQGVDGIVFVADSAPDRMDANLESLKDLQNNLHLKNMPFATLPFVLQLNKRDLPNAAPVGAMTKLLRQGEEPVIEAVASNGVGTLDTLVAIGQSTIEALRAAARLQRR